MEGEDCSMENLGTSADLTGGQVEMVDLQALSTKVGAMLANPIVATGVEVVVIMGAGGLPAGSPDAGQKGSAHVRALTVGNATAKTDLTIDFGVSADFVGDCMPIQLQLRYTRPDGQQILQVCTVAQQVNDRRDEVEADINGTCLALGGIHSAARLAQEGEYRPARVKLISTCRLLQRAMHSLDHQESYLSFIVQAEKLDGFMRERESQERVFGASSSRQSGRDDDASRSMYQMKTLSVEDFTSRV
jgi:hypothetical protein